MVTLRKRPQILGNSTSPKTVSKATLEISGYEQCREKRINENMERMQNLGILDLSLKLKSELLPPPKRSPRYQTERRTPQRSPLLSLQPTRRSSRLQNVTPVTYTEVRQCKKEKLEEDEMGELVGEGSKPEVYTEEHERMLGTCKATWNLFVDGYGKDGKRIYDPVKGKTCHQCRQKTLGHRTHCSNCNLVQGQFCGDCLFMRYGENVLEANQNSSWICPVCRGICNCSLCRQAKGWPPTGTMYRKITKLGFKSVAHYLIETRRPQTNIKEEDQDTVHPVSAKRSLPFVDIDEPSQQREEDQDTVHPVSATRSLRFADTEEPSQQKETRNSDENSGPLSEDTKGDDVLKVDIAESQSLDGKDENAKPSSVNIENDDPVKAEKAERSSTLNSKHEVIYVSCGNEMKLEMGSSRAIPDSIAGRLRQRRNRT